MKKLFGALLIAAGGYAIYRIAKNAGEITLSQKLSRRLAACRQTGCSLLSGIPGIGALGNEYKIIKTPSIGDGFYSTDQRASILAKINQIKNQYGTIVNLVQTMTNVPAHLLYSFIFIESGGNEKAVSDNAYGLMQLSPAGASDMIYLENKRGRLQPSEIALLRQVLGNRFDKIIRMRWMGDGVHVTNADLLIPKFNILVGAIYLGILLDEHIEGEYVRMDKVVARYNRGYFSKNMDGDYQSFYLSQNDTTRNYILKLVGSNGLIDILTA